MARSLFLFPPLVALTVLPLAACGEHPAPSAAPAAASAASASEAQQQSAQTTGTAAKPDNIQVDGVQWTRFNDPNENAFSLDVPQGWKVDGGMVRRGPVDVSTFLRVLSPDSSVLVLMGDPAPAFFHTPGFGAGPGSRPYESGKDFAHSYGESALPSLCSNLAFQNSTDRADIAGGPLGKSVAPAHYEAGEAFFTCTHGGKPARAYIIAGTYIFASALRGMPSMWGTNLIDGFIAPAERFDWTRKVLLHMFLSIRSNPQWVKEQQARVDQATRNLNMITAAQQRAFDSNLANAKEQQRAMTQEYNAFSEVQTQTGTFVDTSGHRYVLTNTQNYHWVSTGGKTAETSSPTPPPGGGWTQLKQVPAQ
jgi:hypothetical protein